MTTEENKLIIERLFQLAFNNRYLSVIDEVIAPDFVSNGFPVQTKKRGPAGFKAALEEFLESFPDLQMHIDKIVAENDLVATVGCWTGTHKGYWMDLMPSGKKVRVSYIDFWKIQNGMCVRNWMQIDTISILDQVGTTSLAAV